MDQQLLLRRTGSEVGHDSQIDELGEEFLATIFYTLGLDLHSEVHDQQNRPIPIVRAEPVKELF